MRIMLVTVITFALTGCASSPERLCASLVEEPWIYVGSNDVLEQQFRSELPVAPYITNEGKSIRSIRHVWYRDSDERLLACTLGSHARDTCSVSSTEFVRTVSGWSMKGKNAVLCNVIQ